MKLATLILELLKRLLDFITQKRINDASRKAKEDPATWFNEHFSDGKRVQSPPKQKSSTDQAGDKGDPKE